MSTKNRIANVIPLPGVGEIESVVKGLINAVKATGYGDDQSESLARRLDGLIAVADTCDEHEDFTNILSHFQGVKSRFETKLESKSKIPGILRAQERLQAYEDLSRELTELVERAQFQLSTSNRSILTKHSAQLNSILVENRAETNRRTIEMNFETIRECDISYDHTSSTWAPSSETLFFEAERFALRHDPVETRYRTGRLGKLQVTYATFSARSDHATATKRVEQALKQLSRMRHPNVAVVVGVTTGYDGLNGFVIAMDGAPIKNVLRSSVAGAFLARCIKGLYQAIDFFWERGSVGVDLFGDGITLAPDGHVTVLLSDIGIAKNGWYIPQWARDPMTHMVLTIYCDIIAYPRMDDRPRAKQMSKLLESLTRLGRFHPTELHLLKIVAGCGFTPSDSQRWELRLLDMVSDYGFKQSDSKQRWDSTDAPPLTIRSGDLVRVADRQSSEARRVVLEKGWEESEEGWEVLKECNEADEDLDKTIDAGEFVGFEWRPAWQSLSGTQDPHCETWVINCHHFPLESPSLYSENDLRWEDVVQRAKKVSKRHNIKLSDISLVTATSVKVIAERPESFIPLSPETLIYFHRNRKLRSSPHNFYGFYSANPDPHAPSTGLENADWRFEYHITYNTKCVSDDWGLRYQRALESSLAAIPGSYPGASVEELSDDEAE